PAVRTGVAMRAGAVTTVRAGDIATVWVLPPDAYLSMTPWQPALSRLLFATMQAMVRVRSGMVLEQTLKASSMQSCCSSAVWAMAAVERAVRTAAIAIRVSMEVPFIFKGFFPIAGSNGAPPNECNRRPLVG